MKKDTQQKGLIDYKDFEKWARSTIPQLYWYSTREEIEVAIELLCTALDLPGTRKIELCAEHMSLRSWDELATKIKWLDREVQRQLRFHTRCTASFAGDYAVWLNNLFYRPIYGFWHSNHVTAEGLPCCGIANYLDVEETKLLKLAKALSGLVMVSLRGTIIQVLPGPTTTHWKEDRLHNEKGPAVEFAEQKSMYFLNGVKMPEWLVLTREGDLDPRRVLKLRNVEVRREFVRKVGIERICYSLDAIVRDKQGNYELLLLFLDDNRPRPYLKMLNPSLGTWHVEGIPPNITTVEEALNWRNQTKEQPEILT